MMLFCEKCGHEKKQVFLFSSSDWECWTCKNPKKVESSEWKPLGLLIEAMEFPINVIHKNFKETEVFIVHGYFPKTNEFEMGIVGGTDRARIAVNQSPESNNWKLA